MIASFLALLSLFIYSSAQSQLVFQSRQELQYLPPCRVGFVQSRPIQAFIAVEENFTDDMGDLQPDETNLLNNNLSQVSITENSAEIFSNANQLPLETVSQNSIGHRNCNTIRCPATQHKMWATNGRICYRFNGFCHMIKENCRRRNRNQRILQPSTRRICRHQRSQLSKSENLSSN